MVALNETLKTPQPSTGQENAEGEAQRIAVMSELVVLMVLDIFSGELRLKVLDNFKEKNPFLPLTENLYDQYFEGSILLANAEIDYAPWGALCSPLERVGLEIDESETLDAPLNLQEFAAQFGSEEGYDGIRCLLARILHRKKGSRRLQEFIGKRTFLDDDVERFDLVHSTMNAYRVLVKQLNAMLLLSSFTAAGLRGPRRSFVGDAKDYVKTFYEWRINAPTSDLIGISALFDRKVSGHPLLESVLDEIERKGSVSVEMPQLELLLTITYDTTRISLMGKLERSGKEIALSSLSKGEDRMLLVKLAQKWSSYLEEPETNLHPTNQAQIGRMLAESLIHYSHFYNAIEDKNHYSTPTAKEEFNGFVPPDVFDEERRSYCAWIQGIRSIRGYEVTFVETHSEPLIRAIQMEIAKNLPRLEWIERANGDLDAHLKQRLQQEPNIEITYFDTVEGKVVPRSLGLRRDGVIAHRISQDFFYDTEPLFAAIFDGIELN